MTVLDLLHYQPQTFMQHAPAWQTILMIVALSVEPVKQLLRR